MELLVQLILVVEVVELDTKELVVLEGLEL
jgi:hypothetical protein